MITKSQRILRPFLTQTRGFISLNKIDVQTHGSGFGLRKYISFDGMRLSPWHDLPLKSEQNGDPDMYTAFFEISRYVRYFGVLNKVQTHPTQDGSCHH